MSDLTTTFCDVCFRPKGETNHWFIVFTRPGMRGVAFGPASDRGLIAADERSAIEDICGQECLHKRLNQWIDDCQAASEAGKESVTA